MSKLHIKKGDTVYVNAGNDRGKTGRVLSVLVKKNKAIVEGINIVSKSAKPSAKPASDLSSSDILARTPSPSSRRRRQTSRISAGAAAYMPGASPGTAAKQAAPGIHPSGCCRQSQALRTAMRNARE